MNKRRKLINVEKAIKGIKKLLTETHDVKQVKSFYSYKGVDITHYEILATSFNIKKSMSKKILDWEREEHGISMLDTILLKIFQLGYEQALIKAEIEEEKKRKMIVLK